MSAYVVSDSTINRIATYLAYNSQLDWLQREFAEIIPDSAGNFGANLGNALFAMNIVAVEARYGEGEAKKFRDLNYKFKIENATSLQVYDSIKQLRYQCCEGDVPDTALYGLLTRLLAAVADDVVERYRLMQHQQLKGKVS